MWQIMVGDLEFLNDQDRDDFEIIYEVLHNTANGGYSNLFLVPVKIINFFKTVAHYERINIDKMTKPFMVVFDSKRISDKNINICMTNYMDVLVKNQVQLDNQRTIILFPLPDLVEYSEMDREKYNIVWLTTEVDDFDLIPSCTTSILVNFR